MTSRSKALADTLDRLAAIAASHPAVSVRLHTGRSIRGTLLAAGRRGLTLRRRARAAPLEVATADIARIRVAASRRLLVLRRWELWFEYRGV